MLKAREMSPNGAAANKAYTVAGISHDGQYLFSGVYSGRLHLSTDRGKSWVEQTPAGATNQEWIACAVDDDMSTILVSDYPGRLWMTQNGGTSWSDKQITGNTDNYWWGVGTNSDGSILIAAKSSTFNCAYLSIDSGTTWTNIHSRLSPAGSPAIYRTAICMNSSGSQILMGEWNNSAGCKVKISFDYGTTFLTGQTGNFTPKASTFWRSSACSSDGSFIILGSYLADVYVSTNYGNNWTTVQPSGSANRDWFVNCDSTGRYCTAADAMPGRLWKSSDYGITWKEIRTEGNVDNAWSFNAPNRNSNANFLNGINTAASGRIYKLSMEQPGKINELKIF